MKRWLVCIWLLLGLVASAEEPSLGVLVVDGDGIWSSDAQDRWRVDNFPEVELDWRELLRDKAVRRLSFEQRGQLLRRPQRILSSDLARHLFTTERVLVLHPEQGRRIRGQLFELSTGQVRYLSADTEESRKEARQALVSVALGRSGPEALPVIGHLDSKLFHLPGAEHLSERAEFKDFPDMLEAEQEGYSPCLVCFPQNRRDALYDDLDRQLGRYVASIILSRYRQNDDPELNQRVANVGRRLLRENRVLDQGYQFVVLESSDINAFAAPTGPLFVTTGLLNILETDDELAGVLGHELSHSERRHARRQFEKSQRAGILGILVTVATGNPWASVGTNFFAGILSRGYSRGYELEADRDGVLAAFGAGYHPEDFLLVQQKLKELEEQRGGGGPGWLRSHPGGEKRVAQVQEMLARLEPLQQWVTQIEQTDLGMSRYVRANAGQVLDRPEEFDNFQKAYDLLAGALEFDTLSQPASRSDVEPPGDDSVEGGQVPEVRGSVVEQGEQQSPPALEVERVDSSDGPGQGV